MKHQPVGYQCLYNLSAFFFYSDFKHTTRYNFVPREAKVSCCSCDMSTGNTRTAHTALTSVAVTDLPTHHITHLTPSVQYKKNARMYIKNYPAEKSGSHIKRAAAMWSEGKLSLLELVWDADRGAAADAAIRNSSSACVRQPINKSGAGTAKTCEAISRKLLSLHC